MGTRLSSMEAIRVHREIQGLETDDMVEVVPACFVAEIEAQVNAEDTEEKGQ